MAQSSLSMEGALQFELGYNPLIAA